jgi:hypothetical protein
LKWKGLLYGSDKVIAADLKMGMLEKFKAKDNYEPFPGGKGDGYG